MKEDVFNYLVERIEKFEIEWPKYQKNPKIKDVFIINIIKIVKKLLGQIKITKNDHKELLIKYQEVQKKVNEYEKLIKKIKIKKLRKRRGERIK